jgi:hypothetical protein
MKVGDLVVSIDKSVYDVEGVGIVMEPPRLAHDGSGRLGPANETYYLIKVLWPAGIDEVSEKVCEVISESR